VLTVWFVMGTQATSACMLLCNGYREWMRGEGRDGGREPGRKGENRWRYREKIIKSVEILFYFLFLHSQ